MSEFGSSTSADSTRPLRILCLGYDDEWKSDALRAETFRRLGHSVRLLDPFKFVPSSRYWSALDYRTGYRLSRRWVARGLLKAIGDERFDLVWVAGGSLVSRGLLVELKRRGSEIVNYNNDDPFGGRDGRRWDTYKHAISAYDRIYVPREFNVAESYAAGARDVRRVWMCYDENLHIPQVMTAEESDRLASEVLFVGTWMPERGPFLATLVARGVPLTIYGAGWQKAPEWPQLQKAWKGDSVWRDDYAKAIQSTKISLGLLSRGNRDEHTIRTFEVPAIGTLLCAERTSEHTELFKEDEEAVFWSSAEECAAKCLELLTDDERRARIAAAGKRRVTELKVSNRDFLQRAISELGSTGPST